MSMELQYILNNLSNLGILDHWTALDTTGHHWTTLLHSRYTWFE